MCDWFQHTLALVDEGNTVILLRTLLAHLLPLNSDLVLVDLAGRDEDLVAFLNDAHFDMICRD